MLTGPETVELKIERLVAGGSGLGRTAAGEVFLVEGTAPGDLVQAEVIARSKARVVTIDRLSDSRTTHPCPQAAAGCGGCDLHFMAPAQLRMAKEDIVIDALRRLGKVDPPPAIETVELADHGFRTSMRFANEDGRLALRQRRTHQLLRVPACTVAHPRLASLLDSTWPAEVDEVVLRVGANTEQRLAVVYGHLNEADLADVLPSDVEVCVIPPKGQGPSRSDAHYREIVRGRTFRVSARSFFQSRTDGAEKLVELALNALAGVQDGARILDLCSGVGLFAGAVIDAIPGAQVTAVESSKSSVADAQHNVGSAGVTVERSTIERYRGGRFDAVIADPPRSGLGRAGVGLIESAQAERCVLVSCDAASLGRDSGLLANAGYRLSSVTLVDMFPHTHHVECISVFER